MGQNWLICNLYGFGKKELVDYDIFNEMFLIILDSHMLHKIIFCFNFEIFT
jgi:hypothetical protein